MVSDSTFVEREGVNTFATLANRARCLWRETPMHDVGVDGHVEYVTPAGAATGRNIAVQIKSGSSYTNVTNGRITYSPSDKHREYWSSYPLPVILAIYAPTIGSMHWIDVRKAIRLNRASPVKLPLSPVLTPDNFLELFRSGGPLPTEPLPPRGICEEMLSKSSGIRSQISYFDLFVNGLTETGRALYFGMDLYCGILAHKTGYPDVESGDHSFIDDYIEFLIAHNIVVFNYEWFDEAAERWRMTGKFLGRLTIRGEQLLSYIRKLQSSWSKWNRGMYASVTQERFVRILFEEDAQSRFRLIEEYKQDFNALADAADNAAP
ncbi:DUF4365 domain-containing protein [Polymorphospora sp. NPDC050346]|uniref:DUF4365 domain-containing protein n=1 Tax=Polymorphospora sp. NPDC050346 TaxID=3155780 RepID=UPI003407DA06